MGGTRFCLSSLAVMGGSLVLATGCGATANSPQGLPSTSVVTSASPTSVPPKPTLRIAETGVFSYDYGYNEAVATGLRTPDECEGLARSVWYQILDSADRELEFLTVYQGCVDGIFNRIPHATRPSDFPAEGVPHVDPCQEGDIDPWVVIYDGPAGSGDMSVGAPCQELAEEFALEQLPPGSFVIESFRV